MVNVTGGMSLYAEQDCIVVEGLPDGESVKVFSLDGVSLFNARSQGKRVTFRPDGRGLYVVVVGTHSYKVALR